MNIATAIRQVLKSRGINDADAESVVSLTLEELRKHVEAEVEESAARRGLTVQQAAEMDLGRDIARKLNAKNGRA